MPDAAPPVNRFRRSYSRSNLPPRGFDIVYNVSTLQVVPLRSSSCLSPDLVVCQAFSFRVHDHSF
jgi:hypothetical protein